MSVFEFLVFGNTFNTSFQAIGYREGNRSPHIWFQVSIPFLAAAAISDVRILRIEVLRCFSEHCYRFLKYLYRDTHFKPDMYADI